MDHRRVLHLQNDPGVPVVHVGAKEFMCIGATPPFDHPHVFLDMGSDDDIICQYCSTLFKYRADLAPAGADPAGCLWRGDPDGLSQIA